MEEVENADELPQLYKMAEGIHRIHEHQNFDEAKAWLQKAKQSTKLPQELKAINKSMKQLKRMRSKRIDKIAKKYNDMTNNFKHKVDINDEHNLVNRDAIWTYGDKQSAEYGESNCSGGGGPQCV